MQQPHLLTVDLVGRSRLQPPGHITAVDVLAAVSGQHTALLQGYLRRQQRIGLSLCALTNDNLQQDIIS